MFLYNTYIDCWWLSWICKGIENNQIFLHIKTDIEKQFRKLTKKIGIEIKIETCNHKMKAMGKEI